ncbi:MarR family winged helix-turn-helix transcriptional regulator [Phytoactinopolyspora halotolerans]|nr:MarR family transcriptional regulator [Phytoactinopolyspora halotolerans]
MPIEKPASSSTSGTPLAAQPRTQASLASSLRMAIGRLNRRLRNEREDDSLTLNQLSALGALERLGPTPVGELAAHERVRPPSMTRIISNLEELGLVVREPHPVDRRLAVVRITEAGLGKTAADRKRRNAWLANQLRTLTPEERKQLRDVLPILEKLTRS